jgi:NAD(P)-dependent dehydrogenase (short-subunit alcohol dehydrogenase family)
MKMAHAYSCQVAKRAFILGGAKQIGYAAAQALTETGWHIKVGNRLGNPVEL